MFNQIAGIYALLILTLSKDFLNQAIIATEDMPSYFFMLLSLFFSQRYIDYNKRIYFILSWFVAGLAIGTKLTTAIAIIPIILFESRSLLSNDKERKFQLSFQFAGFLFMTLAFILTTPSIFINFDYFLEDFVYQVQSRWGMATKNFVKLQSTYMLHLINLIKAGGYPLFYVYFFGMIFCLFPSKKGSDNQFRISLVVLILIYFAFVGSWQVTLPHYMILLIPILSIFSGKLLSRLQRSLPEKFFVLTLSLLIVYSLFYTYMTFEGIRSNPQREAKFWVNKSINKSKIIDGWGGPPTYHPPLVNHNFFVFPFIKGPNSIEWEFARERLQKKIPDFIFLSEPHFSRYLEHPTTYPRITQTIFELLTNQFVPYRIVKTFGPQKITDYSIDARLYRAFFSQPLHPINPAIIVLKKHR